MQSTFAPPSISIKQPSLFGITGANAILLIPLIRLTIKVEPTTKAPLLPAEIKASPSFAANRCKPSAIEHFDLDFIISPAWSSIVITSGTSAISILLSEMSFSFATRRISFSRPVRSMSTSNFSTAMAQPFKISSGALSPPKASTMNFILTPLLLKILYS